MSILHAKGQAELPLKTGKCGKLLYKIEKSCPITGLPDIYKSKTANVSNGFGKGLRSFLRQVVSNAAAD